MAEGKPCWTLAELSVRWSCSENDLLYMSAEGRLMLSVWCKNISYCILPYPVSRFAEFIAGLLDGRNDIAIPDIGIERDRFLDDLARENEKYIYNYTGWCEIVGEDYAVDFLSDEFVSMGSFVLNFNESIAFVQNVKYEEIPREDCSGRFTYKYVVQGDGEYLVRRGEIVVRSVEVERLDQIFLKSGPPLPISPETKTVPKMKKPPTRDHELRELIAKTFEDLGRPDNNKEVWEALKDPANNPDEVIQEILKDRINWISTFDKNEQHMKRKTFKNYLSTLRKK